MMAIYVYKLTTTIIFIYLDAVLKDNFGTILKFL